MADQSPEQIRDRLSRELKARQPDITRLYRYYRGDHPLPWAPKDIRDAYLALMRMSRSNWCRLVVKAPSERLRVVGMRFSADSGGDVAAWEKYWQGNRLDLESRMVHDAALIARRGFVLVWPSETDGDEDDAVPSITPEHPSQMIVEYEPGCRRERTAALKEFVDDVAKKRYCTLWTPEKVYNWSADWYGIRQISDPVWVGWNDAAAGMYEEADNPLGVVPVVEFIADPAMVGEPMGELDGGVTEIQDRINKTILDRLVTANFSSFKQKWATGLDIPQDENGNDVEPFKAAVNRLFVSENENAKFGEFQQSDLSGYITSVEADIQHLAAITRTPPHYLLGQSGAFPSGESLKATETGLVAKVGERRDSFTESWEDVMRLALLADGDSRASDMALSMVWKDPESRSIAEVTDAAVKMLACGVPQREVWRFMGYTPSEIELMDQERAEDAANGLLANVGTQQAALGAVASMKALPPGAAA